MLTVVLMWAMNFVSLMPQTAIWGTIALFLFGFLLFAKTKLSFIKQGQILSFDPYQMSRQNRISYFMGYGVMCLGFFLLLGLALTAR
jgi:hypothetical protein